MQDCQLEHRPVTKSGSRLQRWLAAALLMSGGAVAVAPLPASAQSASATDDYIELCPSVQGADCQKVPPPDTAVPAPYRASYRAYLDMKQAAGGGRQLAWDDKPDWSGLWDHAGGFNWDPQPTPLANAPGEQAAQAILDHCKSFPCEGWVTAALTPEFALRYREKLTAVAHGFEWDQLSDCLPAGHPRFLLEPVLHQFVVTPQQTLWISEWQSETRRLYTDGRGHVPEQNAFALWEGDSIGFWDGDTLVVHTIRMKPEELQRNQPSISDQASTVERIRMIDPNTIEDDVTLWDPKALRKPWHGVQVYRRVTTPGLRLDMYACEENNNVIQTEHGGSTFILPGETVTVERHYRDPSNFQNANLERAIAYGAQLMKEEEATGVEGENAKTP